MSREPGLTTKGSLLSSGYVALDVILDGQDLGHRAGGTAANVAANLSFLGWKAQIAAVVGSDPAGQHLKSDLTKAKVDVQHVIKQENATTPVVIHEILSDGHRFRFGCPECGRRFPRHRPIGRNYAQGITEKNSVDVFFFDRVSLGTLVLAEAVREKGGLVVFEPATKGRPDQFRRALECAHIVKMSHERLNAFQGLIKGPERTQLHVLTNGGGGAEWRLGGSRWRHVPGFELDVVDAGGAGDWTTAAMLASLPSLDPAGFPEVDFAGVLRTSQAVAALSCQARGARGLSQVFTLMSLTAAVDRLLGDRPPNTNGKSTLRRSRRIAECTACLA